MKISNISLYGINKENDLKKTHNFKTKPMPMDTFEKSNVSFRGDSFSDIFDTISMFSSLLSGFGHLNKEIAVRTIMNTYENKNTRTVLKQNKGMKIEPFISHTLTTSTPQTKKEITELFEKAGITNVGAFSIFATRYFQNHKPFITQEAEAVEIYGILTNKNDLPQFAELLLYQYNEEINSEDEPNLNKLNETTAFLRKIGLNNFKDFDTKFSHLKSKFNDFKDISDKSAAIEYLQKTYPNKISILDTIIKQHSSNAKQNPEILYASTTDIIDYFYEVNNGKSLDGLEEIIDYVQLQNKLKESSINAIKDKYDGLNTPKDKIKFFKDLKNYNISITEFSKLMTKNVVSDVEPLGILINKDCITEIIQACRNKNTVDSNDFYKHFKDALNATYNDESSGTTKTKDLIETINKFKLKDSNHLLEFYNKANGTRKNSITSAELKEFIELTKFADSPAIIDDARKQKTTAVELLKKEQEFFLSIEPTIEEFIINDTKDSFIGETPFSIYKKYRREILKNPQDISSILRNIIRLNISSPEEYKAKTDTVKAFSKFIPNKKFIMDFFAKNDIKLDCSEEENTKITNILTVFNTVYDEENRSTSDKRIKYFVESDFFSQSENKLDILLSKLTSKETRQNILCLIADKKIPSLNHLEIFIKEYAGKDDSAKNLIEYIRKSPEKFDFETVCKRLTQLQNKLDRLGIPLNITAKNILKIGYQNPKTITEQDIIALLSRAYDSSPDRNFLSTISASNKSNDNEEKITSYKIAREIANYIDKSPDSYKNITRLLEIDRESLKIDENDSTHTYAQAIRENLPYKFINFVKSNDWLKYSSNDKETPNLTLHAKLRLIDRFALNNAKNIDELYTDKTKSKLKELLKTVYTQTPTGLRCGDETKRLIVDFKHKGTEIEAVFSPEGQMITIVPRRKS